MPGRRSVARVTTAAARSAVKVGEPRWSSTKRSVRSPCGQAQHGPDHVGPVGPAHPRGADDGGPGRALPLAAQLGPAVDRERVGLVPLDVGARGRPVEDVVGREVDEVGPATPGRLGHVAGAQGVDREGPVGIALAGVDRRPGARRGPRRRGARRPRRPSTVGPVARPAAGAWSAPTTSSRGAPGPRGRRAPGGGPPGATAPQSAAPGPVRAGPRPRSPGSWCGARRRLSRPWPRRPRPPGPGRPVAPTTRGGPRTSAPSRPAPRRSRSRGRQPSCCSILVRVEQVAAVVARAVGHDLLQRGRLAQRAEHEVGDLARCWPRPRCPRGRSRPPGPRSSTASTARQWSSTCSHSRRFWVEA